MTEQQIKQAFEGRWRIKGNFGQINQNRATMNYDDFYQYIKSLCRDFFETGILLASLSECQTVSPSVIPLSTIIDTDVEVNGFDFFWNAYEKKVGRPKCEKLWTKLTLAEKKACLEYIPLYKQAQPDKQFRKNPETFLRNKSWQDEIIVRNNPDLQRQQRIAASAELVARYAAESNSAQSEAPATD